MSKNTLFHAAYAARLSAILATLPVTCHIQLDVKNDFTLPANWGFRDRVNPNYHLAYVRSGEGQYVLGDRAEAMVKGKVILVSPGYSHSRVLNPLKLPNMSLVRFSICSNMIDSEADGSVAPFAFAFEPRNKALFHSLFDQLACRHKDESLQQTLCGSIITQILAEMYVELIESKTDEEGDPRLWRAVKFMHENMQQAVSMKQLAELAGLSVNYFRLLFKRQYGKNPHEYLTEIRIRRARELLMETDDKVKDIAQALGYCDSFAFSKQFKAVLGVAPSYLMRRTPNDVK